MYVVLAEILRVSHYILTRIVDVKLKSVHLRLAGSSHNFIDNFVSFQLILLLFLHFIDFGEHFIVIERNLKFDEKEDEKNEDENFQLHYYLSYIVKSGIDGVPNHCTLQICI